jgi:hypothetical protein
MVAVLFLSCSLAGEFEFSAIKPIVIQIYRSIGQDFSKLF